MSDRSVLNCSTALDRFAMFLDGELGFADGRPVEAHLEACGTCLERARGLAEVHRDLALLRARDARDPIPALIAKARWDDAGARRSRRRRLRLPSAEGPAFWGAAAAVALAGLLLIAALGTDRPPAAKRFVRENPALPMEIPAPDPPIPSIAPWPPIPGKPEATPEAPEHPRAPEPRPESPPAVVEPEVPPVRSVTLPEPSAAVARVERAGKPSETVAIGATLAPDGFAVVVYPDGSRLFLGAGTTITIGGRGKAIAVARGEVTGDVAPQPRQEPMVFTTANAEVHVLGTVLTVSSRPDSTVVTVEKGRVQVTRRSDRWSVTLREGQGAAVEPGRLPTARPLPANLLADPGFEADGRGWEGIFNRGQNRNFGGISVTPDVFRSGGRAVQFITEPTPGYDREVFQDVPVVAGETVELSGWLRTSGIGGPGVSLSLLWLGPGNFSSDITELLRTRGLVLREDRAGVLTGTNDWTRIGARAVAPRQAKQVRVLMYADVDPGGPATAWGDDLVLRRIQKGK